MAFRVGDIVRHPDHGDWKVTWTRKDRMALERTRGNDVENMVVGGHVSPLKDWVIVPPLQ